MSDDTQTTLPTDAPPPGPETASGATGPVDQAPVRRGRSAVAPIEPTVAPGATASPLDAQSPDLVVDATVDPDLAPFTVQAVEATPRVTAMRRRQPETVPVLYKGRKQTRGGEFDVTIVVPDEDNDEKAAALMVAMEDAWGPRKGEMHVSGPTYQFRRGEVTRVYPEDVDFLVNHTLWEFVPQEEQE